MMELSINGGQSFPWEKPDPISIRGHYPKQDSQILREIDYTCRFYGLEPKMFVAYDRIALSGNEDKELRVTFDEKIRYRNQQLDLTKGSGGTLQPVPVRNGFDGDQDSRGNAGLDEPDAVRTWNLSNLLFKIWCQL